MAPHHAYKKIVNITFLGSLEGPAEKLMTRSVMFIFIRSLIFPLCKLISNEWGRGKVAYSFYIICKSVSATWLVSLKVSQSESTFYRGHFSLHVTRGWCFCCFYATLKMWVIWKLCATAIRIIWIGVNLKLYNETLQPKLTSEQTTTPHPNHHSILCNGIL